MSKLLIFASFWSNFLERMTFFSKFATRKYILLYRSIHAGRWGSAVYSPESDASTVSADCLSVAWRLYTTFFFAP